MIFAMIKFAFTHSSIREIEVLSRDKSSHVALQEPSFASHMPLFQLMLFLLANKVLP